MNAKAETRSISMEYDLPHPAAKVWRALTDPELLAAWLMVNDMRPLVGHGFTFKAEPTPWWDGMSSPASYPPMRSLSTARAKGGGT